MCLPPPVLTSVGTVLIDCFTFLHADGSERKPALDQIGGGGLYAIIGARMWLSPSQTRILVDTEASPLARPVEFAKLGWKFGEEMWVWRTSQGSKSLKAGIEYKGKERRFRYLSSPLPITPHSLISNPSVQAKYLHLCSSPSEVLAFASAIASADPTTMEGGWKPRIVWEPHPMYCTLEYLEETVRALGVVEVLSPNHEEAAALLSLPPPSTVLSFEHVLTTLLALPTLRPQTSIVLRCGALGACVGTRLGGICWVPAYWKGSEKGEVRDVTGAGNSFLGGLVAGLEREGGDVYRATPYANISASFVVQQFGLPSLTRTTEDGEERWNGVLPSERLEKLRGRMSPQN